MIDTDRLGDPVTRSGSWQSWRAPDRQSAAFLKAVVPIGPGGPKADPADPAPGVSDLARGMLHALDPVAFARDALAIVADDWQARALRSTARQLIFVTGRQCGKSTTASTMAVHTAGFEPGALVLVAAPSLRQAVELTSTIRGMLARLGSAIEVASESAMTIRLRNGSRIAAIPGSSDTIRGFARVRLLVVDEAGHIDDALLASLRPTLAVGGGRLVLCGTPNGKQGPLWRAWSEGGPDWHRERVRTDQCSRVDATFLAQERAALGSWRYATEFEAEFADTEHQFFASEVIRRALSADLEPLRI